MAKAAKREFGGLSLSVPRSPLEESFGSLDRRPRWWAPSFERLIAASGGLLVAQGPRALEQVTAELIGAELYRAVHDEKTGLRFDAWAMELISRAIERMVDAAGRGDNTWRGPWWLLQGLAAIGSYGLGAFAWEQASEAAGELPRDIRAAEPAWLKLLPDIKATGHVLAMRDAYGTRFGVIADFSYPGGADPSAYLLDFDASGFTVLAGAGVFDDVERAAAAWRDQVGVSAEGLTRSSARCTSAASSCRSTARGITTLTWRRWRIRLPSGIPNGMATSPAGTRSRRWRRSGWRGCCPAPSTRSRRTGRSSSASSSATGEMTRSRTRRWPCSPNGFAGTASSPACPLP